MDSSNEITQWVERLASGEDEAAERIWNQFFHRVRALAEKKLGAHPRRDYDADDLALSALNSLCIGAREGRFRQLADGNDLWQILAMITSRKAALQWRKQGRKKELGESVLANPSAEEQLNGLLQVADEKPDGLVDALSATCQELLSTLDDRLQQVALLSMQGFNNEEIAQQIDRSVKSVERYRNLIREQWSAAVVSG